MGYIRTTVDFDYLKSETPSANNSELVSKVQILEKKIEHQSSILRESEATNARLRFDIASDWLQPGFRMSTNAKY